MVIVAFAIAATDGDKMAQLQAHAQAEAQPRHFLIEVPILKTVDILAERAGVEQISFGQRHLIAQRAGMGQRIIAVFMALKRQARAAQRPGEASLIGQLKMAAKACCLNVVIA